MSDPAEDPAPPPELPDDLVERVRGLDDLRLRELVEYSEELLDERTRPVAELVRETEDPDRIVSIDDEGGYATVVRRDTEDGPPILYHVRREHHPDGSVDLRWRLVGEVVE